MKLVHICTSLSGNIRRDFLNIIMSSYQYKDLHVKIRWCRDRFILKMRIPIHGKDGLYIETGPCIRACLFSLSDCMIKTRQSKRLIQILIGECFHHILKKNKRPVGLYSPRTAGIMTDFVIMMLSSINKMEWWFYLCQFNDMHSIHG